jgi:hypothetical protein
MGAVRGSDTVTVEEEDLCGISIFSDRVGRILLNTSNLSRNSLIPSLSPVRYFGDDDMSAGS